MKKIIGIIKKVDLRDVLLVGGLASLWWGLFIFQPWISYAVCGALMLLAGYFSPAGKGE